MKRRHLKRAAIVLLLAMLYLGTGLLCSNPAETDDECEPHPDREQVVTKALTSGVSVYNNTILTIYWQAFNQNALVVIDWSPCESPENCPDRMTEACAGDTLSYQDIFAWEPGTMIAIHWWHLVEDDTTTSGYRIENYSHLELITPVID